MLYNTHTYSNQFTINYFYVHYIINSTFKESVSTYDSDHCRVLVWPFSSFSFFPSFPLFLTTWLCGDALYDNFSCQRNRTISHFDACVRLKREKSRLGFIISTIARSTVQSTILLPFHSSYPSSPETPFRLSFRTASFLSANSHLTKHARFLETENHIRLDAACIPFSFFSSSAPRRTADARIIAAKPCHKAVPHHKDLFNPWTRRKRRIGMRIPPASLSNILPFHLTLPTIPVAHPYSDFADSFFQS